MFETWWIDIHNWYTVSTVLEMFIKALNGSVPATVYIHLWLDGLTLKFSMNEWITMISLEWFELLRRVFWPLNFVECSNVHWLNLKWEHIKLMIMLFGAHSLWFRFKCIYLVSDIELKPHTVRGGEDEGYVQDPTIVEFKNMAIQKHTIIGVPDQETGFVGKSQTNW